MVLAPYAVTFGIVDIRTAANMKTHGNKNGLVALVAAPCLRKVSFFVCMPLSIAPPNDNPVIDEWHGSGATKKWRWTQLATNSFEKTDKSSVVTKRELVLVGLAYFGRW